MTRIAIIGSGAGSNFSAIAQAVKSGNLPVEIALVLSDSESSGILKKAQAAQIPTSVIDCSPFRQKFPEKVQTALVKKLKAERIDLVCLAGFMRIIGQPLIDAFPLRIINIHPSLLPHYPGLMAWKQAIDNGATVSGCTVHYVDAGVDTGPVILQKEVPVQVNDTAETLHERIQEAEHTAYPEAIAQLLKH